MAYATYTTDALVCGTFDKNTADRSYLLFTREAGMLYADARSVREERSKQRYALQDFSSVRVSLVKGKGGWRVGSIEPIENHYLLATDKAARGSVVSIVRFVRRFVGAEEANPAVFDAIQEALRALRSPVAARAAIERVVLVRVLVELGYVDEKRIPDAVRTTPLQVLLATPPPPAVVDALERIYAQAVTVSHL